MELRLLMPFTYTLNPWNITTSDWFWTWWRMNSSPFWTLRVFIFSPGLQDAKRQSLFSFSVVYLTHSIKWFIFNYAKDEKSSISCFKRKREKFELLSHTKHTRTRTRSEGESVYVRVHYAHYKDHCISYIDRTDFMHTLTQHIKRVGRETERPQYQWNHMNYVIRRVD